MPIRREVALVLVPALLLISGLVGFTCVRDTLALDDPSPLIVSPPIQQ